jgi:hypothetical protein
MKKFYRSPRIYTESTFETCALGCSKSATPPLGSHHLTSAYDTFSGHTGTWLGSYPTFFTLTENITTGVGYGTGCTSQYMDYTTACVGVVTYTS